MNSDDLLALRGQPGETRDVVEVHGELTRWQVETIRDALTAYGPVSFPEGDLESERRCDHLAQQFANLLHDFR